MKVKPTPLPMQEAQNFWRDKVILGPAQFRKLSTEAKIKAFAISGIAKGDELSTVFNALQRAIDKGTTFADFKKECGDIFERRGWTGKRAWRVDNIFRTNIQTAYNVGKYKQVKEMADTFPYLRYSAINDNRTRPAHRAVDGLVFPVGHPFWDNWYPPNGYRCRCTTTALTKGMVERRGLKIESDDPTGKPIMAPNHTNPIQLLPDPGFMHHPGKVVHGSIGNRVEKISRWSDMPNLKTAADFKQRVLKNVRPAQISELPAAMLAGGQSDDFYQAEFKKLFGVEKLLTDPVKEPVVLSLRSFMQNKTQGAQTWKFNKPGHGESIPLLADMVQHPFEIWLTPQINEQGQIRLTKRYISLWKSEDKSRIGGFSVFEVVRGEFRGVTTFAPLRKGKPDLKYLERQRQGLLLYGR